MQQRSPIVPNLLISFFCCCVTLMDSISGIVNPEIINLSNDHLIRIMVYGSKVYNTVTNKLILEATIRFIKASKRFKYLEAYAQGPNS